MTSNPKFSFLNAVLSNMPADWLNLTTHRLDIYNESLAKVEFLEHFDAMYKRGDADAAGLKELPTAYDYIRLGHPLSCVLEWTIAREHDVPFANVISFSSVTTPILSILRKNLFAKKNTLIIYEGDMPQGLDGDVIESVYGYTYDLKKSSEVGENPNFEGSVILVSDLGKVTDFDSKHQVDFTIKTARNKGSICLINTGNEDYIAEVQHVRRRETIAMTPINCLLTLKQMIGEPAGDALDYETAADKEDVVQWIQEITGTPTKAVVGSSGLSIQYAIMMGLIHDAIENHKGKDIKIVVPPNCYGGTNDQARRVAACLNNVEVVDLPVDGGSDMVQSIDTVLDQIALENAIPYIIAEIPTNPRVEVPELLQLKEVLTKERYTDSGQVAIDPVFILDQTFCPNVHFLGEGEILSKVRAISYASGSKFPSGGRCTAGYCIGNAKASTLMDKVELHLTLCDNEATALQYEILAHQMPSMLQRIEDAYQNTRAFVNFIKEQLPDAKINFVSEELAAEGFTPSVFSLDLPTKGSTDEEREAYKRGLNHKLIKMMITEIPDESKYCVSYGQLKGCYWTIPATSTQGTTKEGDKDYIARVALSADMDMQKHKEVFGSFVKEIS